MERKFYSIGIVVKYGYAGCSHYGWWARVNFEDAFDSNMQGAINTKYGLSLDKAIDNVLETAKSFGIDFPENGRLSPNIFYLDDGKSTEYPPPENWKQLLKTECDRLGWSFLYDND